MTNVHSSKAAEHGQRDNTLTRRDILKRGSAVAAVSLVAPLLTTGEALAAPPASRPRGSATITEWGFGTDNVLAKSRVDAFSKAYPNIKLNIVPQVNDQKILTAVASGSVPDLLWLDRATIAQWAARGALEPLDDLIGKSTIKMGDFYKSAVDQVTYKGHMWAVPQFMDVRPLWIDLDPLKSAGVSLADVQSSDWSKLRTAGIKLTKKQGNKVVRWGFDTKAADGFFWMWAWGNGGDLLSSDGKHASFDDAKNVAALQYVVDAAKAQGGFAAHKAFADTWGWNAQHPFIVNQTPVTPYENWLLGMIAQFAPKHNFMVVPFRGMNGKPVSLSSGSAWAIPKGAGNRDAAFTFIQFMSEPSTWKVGAQADKKVNGTQGAPFIPYLTGSKAIDAMLMKDEYVPLSSKFDAAVKLFPALLEQSRNIPPSPVAAQLNDILTNEAILPALLGQKSPAAALKAAQSQAQQAISSFHG